MSKEELPSIEDLLDKNLPSIEDFVEGDDNLPSVENIVENNNLPSVEDVKEDNDLPSVEDYIEEETVTIEDAEGNTFAEVEDIIPPWPELLKIINGVREEIPDIPEIKYYDAELEKLCEIVDEVRSEIPEVKYYDAEVEAICEQIDLVRNTISELPEVKYYDEQIDSIEDRINLIKEDIINLPEPKYYDNDLQSIREDIEVVKKNFPWIEANFKGVEESLDNVNDSIGTVEKKISLELDSILETVDVKVFENKVLINEVKDNFAEDKQQILADIKESSQKIFDLHDEFKDDDRKLKKQIQGEYNKLKQSVQEQLEKYNQESVKTDELLLKYFTDLKEEISKTPEVKYYDDDIDALQESLTKSNKRFLPIESDIKSLYKIVEDIKKTQQELNEQRSLEEKQDINEDKDPLTPTDQKFATLDDLSKHYSLFVNRIQQQLSSLGGGGETRLEFLDDVDRDSAKVDGKFLKYDSATGKFIGADASGGGGGGSITIKDEGSTVGTAGSVTSIDFVGDNITASASGVGATITFSDTPQFDSLNITGLSTFSDITVSGQLNDLTIPSGSGTIAKTSDVPDTSTLMPKSGGTFTGDITLSNGEYLNLGDTNTFLGNTGSQILFRFGSDIKLQGNTFFFQNEGGTYEFMRLSTTFGTQLKYQGFTKLTVDSTGITVNGQLNDLTIPSGSGTIAITDDIPTNNNELTNGAGYITTSFTNTNQLTNGAGFITASDNITGTAAGLSGSPNINVSAITATSGEFSGNVTIGGTLTYEDVTSIDSVGLVTARLGINVNGGQIIVGSAFSVGQAGVVTASSFVGNLTGSATSLSGVSSSFLLDYNNFTNTPTIPTNNNELTNGAGFITASDDITGTAAGLSGTPNITVGIVTATSVIVGSAVTINSSGLNVLGVVTATTFDGNLAFSNITGISTDIVGDTTPQLGGNLDLNSNDITGTGDFNVTGVITATSFHGDGSNLTGVASTDNIITGTAATFNNVVNVGTGITLDATSGIITASNFFGATQGQVSYITATETLTNKTLRNPTFESGANSPEFLETRYVNATQQDFVQLYTGGSSGSYFTQGEYQKIATITPSGNHQNYTFNIRLTATSASNYQIVNFTGGLRANTLPDLDFTVNFSEEHNGVRFIEPKLWTKETTTAGFILAFEYVHSSSLFGGVNVEATIIPRSSAQRANVAFNTTQDSEQSSIDTGFTERDPTLTLSTVNGVPIFGTEFKIEGSTDNDFETTITSVDATADRTITFPDSSGTVALLGDGVMSDLADDTTPQLGGNLDLNSKDITGTGNINVSGITTISTGIGTVHIGTGSTTLLVDGDARVTGILTIGQGSITLDPNAKKISGIDEIIVGTATTVSIKQNNQGNITFEKEDGEEASVGIGTTVSINTTGIITAATLKASTAFYPPIYTTTQRDAGSFNEGAMIYNSTTKKMEFYNGTSWTSLPGMSLGLTVALDG